MTTDIKTEQDIEKLREAAINLQQKVVETMLELKFCRGDVNLSELKQIVDMEKAKKVMGL